MKTTYILVFLFMCAACSKNSQIRGSGEIVEQNRMVGSFTKVNSVSSINVEIMQGSTQSVEVSADDNVINNVITIVENGALKVNLANGSYDDITINVSIVLPDIEQLENTGSGNMAISGYTNLNNLTIDNVGSGNIMVSGSGITLTIRNSGSGNYKGFNFSVKDCSVTNSGSGSCEISCIDSLNGSNLGSGTVFYRGTATVNITNTGSGEVVDSN